MNATQYAEMKKSQVAKLAAKGRAWIEAEGKALSAALARQRTEGRKDGTVACIAGDLEDLRAAWKLAK